MSSWAATFWAITLAGLAFAPIALLSLVAVEWTGIQPLTLVALLHFTVGAGVFAFVSWFWSLARGGNRTNRSFAIHATSAWRAVCLGFPAGEPDRHGAELALSSSRGLLPRGEDPHQC
jgi:hypothetical protein